MIRELERRAMPGIPVGIVLFVIFPLPGDPGTGSRRVRER